MRCGIAIFAIFLSWTCFQARADDRKLMDRLMKPDMSREQKDLQTKTFQSTDSLRIGKAAMGKPSFDANKTAGTQVYETRSFLGLTNPWFGKKVYKTDKAALWSTTVVNNIDKQYQVKTAETQQFYQAKKKANEPKDPVATTKFIPKGTTQNALNAYSEKATRDLTIDDIRQLLNKDQ